MHFTSFMFNNEALSQRLPERCVPASGAVMYSQAQYGTMTYASGARAMAPKTAIFPIASNSIKNLLT